MTADDGARVRFDSRALFQFLAIAFGGGWALFGLAALFPGATYVFYGLALLAPGLAALMLVARLRGRGGVRRFLFRFRFWRCHWGWYAFLILGIPAIEFVGAAFVDEERPPRPAVPLAVLFAALVACVSEIGWRGIALPLMQRRFAPIWAGGLLGVVWGLWYLPALLITGTPMSDLALLPYVVGIVAVSIAMTPLFNVTQGSLSLPALFHFQFINPAYPGPHPADALLFVLAAAAVVWLYRNSIFRQDSAMREVIPKRFRLS